MNFEQEQKLKAMAEQKCCDGNVGQTQYNAIPQIGLAGSCETNTNWAPPLRDQIDMRKSIASNEVINLSKAAAILKAHPEFEEFLWLLRSGLA